MTENAATKNPYDQVDTCRCSAWSESECACGGYVDRGKVRAWQQGYDAAVRDLTTRVISSAEHDCESCAACLHDGVKCCGCYDGACCVFPSGKGEAL